MASVDDQLVVEKDEQHGREQVETDLIKYLKDKVVQFHTKISSYGSNVASARGIQKVSFEFEILVFGPARVGKSTLIKQVSGDETIMTSAKLMHVLRNRKNILINIIFVGGIHQVYLFLLINCIFLNEIF
jgi:GTPase SAR1 family protein